MLSYVLPLVVILNWDDSGDGAPFILERFVAVDDRFFLFAIVENEVHQCRLLVCYVYDN